MKRLAISLAIAVLWWVSNALAHELPLLHGRVNDSAALLTEAQRAALEEKLAGYERTTGHQFAFLSVPELGDRTIDMLAVDTFAAWKLGDGKRDDGLLFVISKKPRKLKVEVGYGLEGAIPDAVAARIVRDITIPALKQDAYADGVDRTFDALMAAGAAEGTKPPAARPRTSEGGALFWMLLVFGLPSLGFVFVILMRIRDERRRRADFEAALQRHDERDRELGQRVYRQRTRDPEALERVRRLKPRDDPVVEQPARTRHDPTPARKPRRDDTPVTSAPTASPSVSIPDSTPAASAPDPTPFDPGGGSSGGGGFSSDY